MPYEDRLKWDAIHAKRESGSWIPSSRIAGCEGFLPSSGGAALDVAGGNGRHALWLAEKGFGVLLADVSPVALRIAEEGAREKGVVLKTTQMDCEQDPFPEGPWDVIVCHRYLHRPLFESFAQSLSPTGVLIFAQPTLKNLEKHSRPGARYLVGQNELPGLASENGLEVVFYEEGWSADERHEALLIARPGAHKRFDESRTAFPKTRTDLAERAASMETDRTALSIKIKRCDLSKCRGTCCHDGAYLTDEEALVLNQLVESKRDKLADLGIDLPGQAIVYGSWRGVASGPKTATRPAPMREWVSDYPKHFPDTNCVFLHPETAHCGLQLLAEKNDLSKWYYKPTACWMHPLSIAKGENGKPKLTLHDETSDPQRFPDYGGFVCRTHCGRVCDDEEGREAWKLLQEEIRQVYGVDYAPFAKHSAMEKSLPH